MVFYYQEFNIDQDEQIIKNILGQTDFALYFTKLNFVLDLQNFTMKNPSLPNNWQIERWLDSKIGGDLNQKNMAKWEKLYWVEYIADSDIRSP